MNLTTFADTKTRFADFVRKKLFWYALIAGLEMILGAAVVFGCIDEDYYLYNMLGLCAVVIAGVTVLRPHWGYLLVILLMPLRSEDYQLTDIGGAIIRVADVAMIPVAAGWLLYSLFIKKDRKFLMKTEMDIPLIVFFLWGVASLSWSQGRSGTVAILLQSIYACLLFYMSVDLIRTKRFLYMVLIAWVISGAVVGSMSVYESYITPSERVAGGQQTILRETSTQTNALELGEFINYPFMLGIGLYLVSTRKHYKVLLTSALLIMLMAHLTSVARGPIVGLVFGLTIFAVLSSDLRKFLTRELLFIAVVGGGISLLTAFLIDFDILGYATTLIARFEMMIDHPEYDPGILFRIYMWSALLDIIADYPLLGVGFGAVAGPLADATAPNYLETPHNIYLHLLAEIGIIGVMIACWSGVRFFRIVFRALKDITDPVYRTLIVAFIAAIFTKITGGITWGFLIQDRSLWLCFGLGIALIHLAYYEKNRAVHAP